ncbi:unnamed protein product, partial [Timema podura]|nr:unnamed protein product [Timema podura]
MYQSGGNKLETHFAVNHPSAAGLKCNLVLLILGELLPSTSTGLEGQRPAGDRDCSVVFLHLMHSGLLRVKLQHIPTTGRAGLATPLVDGMVVSRRVLGSLVRQTALNTCRRRRLDND